MIETSEDLDKICNILDRLTLDALLLMQEDIQLKLNVENAMCSGESHLAKARYIVGQNNVSYLQLPTEESPEFSAAVKVVTNDEPYQAKSYDLQLIKKSEDETVQEPLRWFGLLVPQNLNHAQNMFRQALQWSVQVVNVQVRLKDTIDSIHKLKDVKASKFVNCRNFELISFFQHHPTWFHCKKPGHKCSDSWFRTKAYIQGGKRRGRGYKEHGRSYEMIKRTHIRLKKFYCSIY